MSLTESYRDCFSKQTRAKGRYYADQGRVHFTSISENAVFASVEGTETYSVVVDREDSNRGELCAECTCPHFADGFACKHIWATLIEIDGCREFFSDSSAKNYSSPSAARRKSRSDKKLATSSSHAKKSKPKKPAPKPPQWQTVLSAIDRQTPSKPEWNVEYETPMRVWFVINVSQSMWLKQLVIDFRQQQIKKDGEWGVVKPLRISRSRSGEVPDELRGLADKLLEFDSFDDDAYGNYSYYRTSYRAAERVALERDAQQLLMPLLVKSERLLWYLDDGHPLDSFQPLKFDDGSPWSLRLQLSPANDTAKNGASDDFLLQARIVREGESKPLGDVVLAIDDYLLFPDRISRADASVDPTWCETIRKEGVLRLAKQDLSEFLKQFHAMPNHPPLEVPESCGVTIDSHVAPTPVLRLKPTAPDRFSRKQCDLLAEVHFKYDNHLLDPDGSASEVYDPDTRRIIVRDIAAERRASEGLNELPLARLSRQGRFRTREEQLLELTEKLGTRGWIVEIEGRPIRSAGEFKLNVTSGIDWFDLDGSIDFDGLALTIPELLKSLQQNERFVVLSDGSQGVLPEVVLKRLHALTDFASSKGQESGLRFQRSQAALLDALLEEQSAFTADAPFRRWRKDLQSLSGVSPRQAPKAFQGELRSYQEEGLGWLNFLQKFSFGGCLADDMGLGKTVQVLALLDQWRTRRLKPEEVRRPSLIVVPSSLIFNWIEEAARFTPKLKVCNYTTRERHPLREQFGDFDIVVTTYGTLRKDIRQLKDLSFDYAILDEAQAIKNSNSLAAKACRLIQARHRLAMTGTPVENHLGELWSLFDFLNPGMLGRLQRFQTLTKRAVEEPQVLQTVSRAVGPFLLRRTKQQVLKDLPEKTEQTIHCTLSNEERRYYNELRDHYRALLTSKINQQGGLKQAKIHVLEALLRLRQAACHPGLIDRSKSNAGSAKIDTLLQQLQEVADEGHKALVFSQFTSLLKIVRTRLDEQGVNYQYLDGKTRDRKVQVDRFQNDPNSKLFLISLKAGGHGLNLTAADYVFILDPWWNPAVEAQAVDRAHRIGQSRPVFAYRFIAKDTVEEKVVELQRTKQELADAIVTANDSLIRTLTLDDLQLLLS